MGSCPFCAAEVDEDLTTFGGPCPKCFAMIPGEDAPTDPGEEVRAAQVESDKRQAGIRPWVPAVLVAMVLLVLAGIVGGLLLVPAPEIVLLDFDEFEDWEEPTIVSAGELGLDGVAEADEPDETEGSETPASKPGPADPVAATPKPRVVETKPAESRQPLGQPSPRPRTTAGGLSLRGDVKQQRRGVALSDPDAIRKSIKQSLSAQIPRLTQCYNQRLKAKPGLVGRWRIRFTVSKDGQAISPATEGLNMKDAEFEACMSREIGRWRFDKLVSDLPVQRTVTFRN